jgi:hypothetical protein
MNRCDRKIAFVAALAAFACNNSTRPGAGDDGGPSRGGANSRAESGTATNGFKLEWTVTDGQGLLGGDGGGPAPTLNSLAGVKVCVHERPDIVCATTDAKGAFALVGLPALTNVVLTLDKDGYVPASKSIQTASTDMNVNGNSILMFGATTLKAPGGVEPVPDTGSVDFFAIGPSDDNPDNFVILSDVGVELIPPRGAGPFFSDARGVYDRDAKKSVGGFGFFSNLPPGEYTLTFTDEKHDCAPVSSPIAGFGVPVPPTSAKFTVLANYLTEEVGVYCLEKSVIIIPDGG